MEHVENVTTIGGVTSRVSQDIALSISQERRPAAQIGNEVDYARVTRGVRMLLAGVFILLLILLILSFAISIDQVAHARGEFIPVQRVQVIQTPEGGAIQDVLVQNDQQVTKGQLIAKFRAADLLRDMENTSSRLVYLKIQIERLDAVAAQRMPDFSPFEADHADMVREAMSHYTGQVQELQSNLQQSDRAIDEQKSTIDAAQRALPSAKTSMDAAQELLQRVKQGAASGIVPRNRVAETEEQAAQAGRTYTQLAASIDQATARIKSIQAQRTATLAKAVADARSQRAELMEQMSELQATAAAYRSRAVDIEVRAPVNGIVQKISETPIGTVIPAGGTVCEIVPTDGGVLLQAHVSPRDIGFVNVGQEANVKSDAFDYARFGSVSGKVARIAAMNTPGIAGTTPYIMVEIELDRPYVGTKKDHVVTPGMTGEVAILTGRQTIFKYLLKPFYTLDSAFSER